MNEANIMDERVRSFIEATRPFLVSLLDSERIYFIDGSKLLQITNEDAMEFLGRDPENGFWNPEIYAQEVFDNFINDQTFYCDKMIRIQKNAQTT